MNIIISINSFWDGGAEMFAIRLANSLANKVNVIFVELEPFKTKEKRQLRFLDKRVRLHQLGNNYLGKLLQRYVLPKKARISLLKAYDWLNEAKIKGIIKKNNIAVINSHSWEADTYYSRLSLNRSVKLIYSFHGHYESLKDAVKSYFDKTTVALGRADKVVYITTRHLQTLDVFNYPREKRCRIFYGIDYTETDTITSYDPQGKLQLAFIARGIKEKGWEEAINAFFKIDHKFPGRINLHLIGDGYFLEELKKKYSHVNLIFHGYKNNVKDFIDTAHICLLPTYYSAESLPNSIIEYLFCGKPVITTNVGAIPEMITVDNEVAGQIVPAEGKVDIDDIEKAVEHYLLQPGLVQKHSRIALKAAKKFTMKECADKYFSLYEEIVG